jgi:hypothetical protein
MSPDLSFSTFALNRRDQLVVFVVGSFFFSTLKTLGTSLAGVTSRNPTSSVESVGTIRVSSP